MLKFAISFQGPIALRYPRGEAYVGLEDYREPIELGKCEEIYAGSKVLLLALGSMVATAEKVRENLLAEGIDAGLVNVRFAKPFDEEYLQNAMGKYQVIVTMEENVALGGMGEHMACFLRREGFEGSILPVAIPDEFVEQGNVDTLKEMLGMDASTITNRILDLMK